LEKFEHREFQTPKYTVCLGKLKLLMALQF
jgi:hypothetical protein